MVLPKGHTVFGPEHALSHIYFLEEGVAGIMAQADEYRSTGCALIGPEGYLLPAAVLGAERVPNRCQMVLDGVGFCVSIDALVTLYNEEEMLLKYLLKFAYVMIVQMIATTFSQSNDNLIARLSRLILMLHDRSFSDDIAITHSDLAAILGVRRPSVTQAMHLIEGKKMISNDRGFVSLLNRSALRKIASTGYGKPELEYKKLIGDFF